MRVNWPTAFNDEGTRTATSRASSAWAPRQGKVTAALKVRYNRADSLTGQGVA